MQSARHTLMMCEQRSVSTSLLQQQDLLKIAESGRRKHGLKSKCECSIFQWFNLCCVQYMHACSYDFAVSAELRKLVVVELRQRVGVLTLAIIRFRHM